MRRATTRKKSVRDTFLVFLTILALLLPHISFAQIGPPPPPLPGPFVDPREESLNELERLRDLYGPPNTGTVVVPPPPAGAPTIANSANEARDFGPDGTCEFGLSISVMACVREGIAALLAGVLVIASNVLSLVGDLFNLVVDFQNVSFKDQRMVIEGWIVVRDVVNIFYIFILLIIAIAMILGIQSYGSKAILIRLIISALLINFSLPLTGLVIDLSNVFGNNFYQNMGTLREKDGKQIRDLAGGFAAGFQPQKTFQRGNQFQAGGVEKTTWGMIIALIAGIALSGVAMFVLFAGAIMLIIRIVKLWLLMVLSPLAFLMYVLPGTGGLFQKWLRELLSESFFYPAYMFFLYITFVMIESGAVSRAVRERNSITDTILATKGNGFSALVENSGDIMSFILLGILMIASIVVAKQVGAHGAGFAIKTTSNVRDRLQGYAGQSARLAGAGAMIGLGRASDAILKTDAAQRLQNDPVGAQLLRVPAALKRREEQRTEQSAKQISKKTKEEAAAQMKIRPLDHMGRAKRFEKMTPEQQAYYMKSMNSEQRALNVENMHAVDPSKDLKKKAIHATYQALGPEEAMALAHPELKAGTKEYKKEATQLVKDMSNADLARVNESVASHPEFKRSVVDSGKDIGAIIKASTGETREAFKRLDEEINSVTGRLSILYPEFKEPPADRDSEDGKRYQELMDNMIADLDEKAISKIKPEAIHNEYVQSSIFKTFSGNDMRRLARTGENANAIRIAIDNQAGITATDSELAALRKRMEYIESLKKSSKNKGLGQFFESTAGRGVMISGRRTTKRDLSMGTEPAKEYKSEEKPKDEES